MIAVVLVATGALAAPSKNRAVSPLHRPISLDISGVPLRQALSEIERAAGVKFGYSDALVDSVGDVRLRVQGESASEFLSDFLRAFNVDYQVDSDGHVTLYKKPERGTQLGFISGHVTDDVTGEPISHATIAALQEGRPLFSILSRMDGSFEIGLTEGIYVLTVNGMTFLSQIEIVAGHRAIFRIRLKRASLPAVEIYAPTTLVRNRSEVAAGFHSLSLAGEDLVPRVGSPDISQNLQTLPGVAVFNDYSSKLFIRGSPPGHISFLIDGLPIEMPYHLFGLASIVNPHLVEQVDVSSGVFSVRYGDRVGGVVDVRTRTPTHGLTGQIGFNPAITSVTLSARLSSKADMLISGRRSHHNFASRVFRGEGSPYYFGDIYSKIGYQLTARDRLSVRGFYARDDFLKRISVSPLAPQSDTRDENHLTTLLSWYNWSVGASWTHDLSSTNQLKILYARSRYSVKDGEENYELPVWAIDNFMNNHISRQTLTGNLSMRLNAAHQFRIGSELNYHKLRYAWRDLNFQMTSPSPIEDTQSNRLSIFFESASDELDYEKRVLQSFSYLEHTWQPHRRMTVEAGLRFEKRSFIKSMFVAPRINLGYQFGKNVVAKAAYGKFYQGLTTAIDDTLLYMLPLLIPLENDLEIQTAEQYGLGLQADFNGLRLSIEGYYKQIDNQLTFFTTASDTAFQELIGRSILSRVKGLNITSRLSQGNAVDYGVELALRKHGKRFNWDFNYVWSYAKQDLPSLAKLHGAFNPADQRHTVRAFGRYRFNADWQVAFGWSLISGRPRTHRETGLGCGPENPCRYPAYHRLDLTIRRSFEYNAWKIAAYLQLPDIYRRANASRLLYYELDWGQDAQISKRSLFPVMPVVPTFGVNVEF